MIPKFFLSAHFDPISAKKLRALMENFSARLGSNMALSFQPHFAIRNDFEIEPAKLDPLLRDLASFFATQKQFPVHCQGLKYYFYKSFYLEIKKTKYLQHLHNQAMKIIQKYRNPWINPELLKDKEKYPHQQQAYISKYGYHYSFEYFDPHITLAGTDIEDIVFAQLKDVLTQTPFALTATVTSLDLVDRNNANTIFKSFSLKG